MVKFIRYRKIFKLYEALQPYLKYSLKLEKKLPARKALVIAPHQDDEAIGCGGTIHLHVKQGGTASVIYCTGGGDTRKKEAIAAADVLGLSDPVFMDYRDESLSARKDFARELAELLREKKPEIVFAPFHLDNHTDHRAVNEALIKAGKNKNLDFLVYAYPVWFPLYPNLLIDISGEWDSKKRAINCYRSQTETRDYVRMSHSLGQYWAAVKGRDIQVAESFFRASLKEYAKLGEKILG
ncbi:MAG: PIG-L deacetylase family protein [Elusimicrobiota bacterium]